MSLIRRVEHNKTITVRDYGGKPVAEILCRKKRRTAGYKRWKTTWELVISRPIQVDQQQEHR